MPTIPMQSTDAQEAAIAYLVAQLHADDPTSTVTADDFRQARYTESLERCVAQARDHVRALNVASVEAMAPKEQAAIIQQVSGVTVDPALLSQTEAPNAD